MNSLKNYSGLITRLPVNEQAFKSYLKTWNKFRDFNKTISKAIDKTFENSKLVNISRLDLFDIGKSNNMSRFILNVIIWGYPRGMRGNNFKNISSNYKKLVNHLKEIKSTKTLVWTNEIEFINSFKGLGISTYSKFLYFLNLKIEDYSCLILDLRLIKTFSNTIFKELIGLKGINYYNALKNYPEYLKSMNELSTRLGVKPDQLELFLFMFSNNLKI